MQHRLALTITMLSPSIARASDVLQRAANAAHHAGAEQTARRMLTVCTEHRIAFGQALGSVAMLPLLTAIAVLPCTLAMLKKAYAFSYAYALSMATIGLALLLPHRLAIIDAPSHIFSLKDSGGRPAIAAKMHAALILVHGVRLVLFLRARARRWPGWAEKVEALEGPSPEPLGKRVPLVLGASLFYALMCSPAAFHSAAAAGGVMHGSVARTTWAGLVLSAFALLLEAAADWHKLSSKVRSAKQSKQASAGADVPVMDGPFAFARHINYFAEILFWAGSFIAGLHATFASAGTNGDLAWRLLASMSGLLGITAVMLGSSARLDAAQRQKYCSGDHPARAQYERYCARCSCLVPFVGGSQAKTKTA